MQLLQLYIMFKLLKFKCKNFKLCIIYILEEFKLLLFLAELNCNNYKIHTRSIC
jgi:hypothetical protein